MASILRLHNDKAITPCQNLEIVKPLSPNEKRCTVHVTVPNDKEEITMISGCKYWQTNFHSLLQSRLHTNVGTIDVLHDIQSQQVPCLVQPDGCIVVEVGTSLASSSLSFMPFRSHASISCPSCDGIWSAQVFKQKGKRGAAILVGYSLEKLIQTCV